MIASAQQRPAPWLTRDPRRWESVIMVFLSVLFSAGAFAAVFVPRLRLSDRPEYGTGVSTIKDYYDNTHVNAVQLHAVVALTAAFAFLGFAVLLAKHMAALSDNFKWHWLPRTTFAVGALVVWGWGFVVSMSELTLGAVAPPNYMVGFFNLLVNQPVIIPAVGAALTMVAVSGTIWRSEPTAGAWLSFGGAGLILGPVMALLVLVWRPVLLLYALWVSVIAVMVAWAWRGTRGSRKRRVTPGAPTT